MLENLTPWEYFNSQNAEFQAKTVIAVLSPYLLTIAATFSFMSTLNNLYSLSDRQKFWLAYGLSSLGGGVTVFFLAPVINGFLNYELFTTYAVPGAIIITPWASHFTFKLVTLILYLVYLIADAVPNDLKLAGIQVGWIGKPFTFFSSRSYEVLRGKPITRHKKSD